MIKLKSELPERGIEIDLTGPDGNAFFLMGTAKRMGREVGDVSQGHILMIC